MRQQLRIEGLAAAVRDVEEVGERAMRPAPVLRSEAVRRDLQASAERRFRSGLLRRGSADWIRRKRREGLDQRTMRATNRLYRALTQRTGIRQRVVSDRLEWGIRPSHPTHRYAKIQADRGREVVVIDRPATERVAGRVERFLATGFTDR